MCRRQISHECKLPQVQALTVLQNASASAHHSQGSGSAQSPGAAGCRRSCQRRSAAHPLSVGWTTDHGGGGGADTGLCNSTQRRRELSR